MTSHIPGHIYLIHFCTPYRSAKQGPGKRPQHAQHYCGWSADLHTRLTAHHRGNGARLMRVIKDAGIEWQLARVWAGDRFEERRLKGRGGRGRLCPICRGTGKPIAWETLGPAELAALSLESVA